MKGPRRISLFLFFFVFLVYGAYIVRVFEPHSYLHGDPGWMFLTVQSLVKDGDLDLRNQLRNNPAMASDQTSMGKGGEWYPLHEYLIAILAVPFYLLNGAFGCLIFNFCISIIIAMVIYMLCLRHATPTIAFLSACLTAFSPVLVNYSYSFSLDVFSTMLLLLAYWIAVSGRPFWTGVVFGIAVFGRVANIFTLPAFILFFLLGRRAEIRLTAASLRETFLFLLGGVPLAVCFLASNYLLYGNPLETAYHNWLVYNWAKKAFEVATQGTAFTRPLLDGLAFNILDTEQGVLVGAPLMIIALVCGVPSFWKKARGEALLWILVSASILIAYSKYSIPYAAFGNRYLMPVVALSAVPFAYALKNTLEPGESH